MAISKKRIESFHVQLDTLEDFTFEEIICCPDFIDKHFQIRGKEVTVRILSQTDTTVTGLVETSRNNNIPPKKSRSKKKIEQLGLNGDEGLAYANVFLYEKKRKLLMYEVNKFGCFVDHFLLYINRCCRKHERFKAFDIKLKTVLKSNEYDRMLKMRFHKSIEVQIAHPKQIIEDYKHKNDAIFNVCSSGAKIGSTVVKTKFEVKIRDKSLGLFSAPLKDVVDNALELVRGPKGDNVEKLIVEGYETDSEDGKLTPIDLIADRYLRTISLDEPRQNIDLLEKQRQKQIERLYKESVKDFDKMFGK